MASHLIEVPPLPALTEPKKAQVTGTNHFSSESFEFVHDALVSHLAYTKPVDTDLTVSLVYPDQDGGGSDFEHSIPVLVVAAADLVTSGLGLSGLEVSRRGKAKLLVSTSGGSSGAKSLTVVARRVGGVS